MPTHWLSLSARVSERKKSAVSAFLWSRGATGLTENHAGLTFPDGEGPLLVGDPGEWTPPPPPSPDARVQITGWFADDGQADGLLAGLTDVLADLDEHEDVELSVVPDQDWNSSWKDQFQPVRIAPGVWVVPSWCEAPPEATGDLHLRMDPGMAFGTGTHPTTARCVTLIGEEVARRPGGSVLDVGTGTGILAIAALKLGAASGLGVDPDPNSVAAAIENARMNGIADRLQVLAGSVDDAPRGTSDLVVANLLAPLLKRLADSLCRQIQSER